MKAVVLILWKKQQKKIIKEDKLIRDELESNNYIYTQRNGEIFNLNLLLKTCSCGVFMDKATCKHIATLCIKERLPYNGLKYSHNILKIIRRRRASDAVDESLIENNSFNLIDQNSNVNTEPNIESVQNQIIHNKRGRPRKASKALEPDYENL